MKCDDGGEVVISTSNPPPQPSSQDPNSWTGSRDWGWAMSSPLHEAGWGLVPCPSPCSGLMELGQAPSPPVSHTGSWLDTLAGSSPWMDGAPPIQSAGKKFGYHRLLFWLGTKIMQKQPPAPPPTFIYKFLLTPYFISRSKVSLRKNMDRSNIFSIHKQ